MSEMAGAKNFVSPNLAECGKIAIQCLIDKQKIKGLK